MPAPPEIHSHRSLLHHQLPNLHHSPRLRQEEAKLDSEYESTKQDLQNEIRRFDARLANGSEQVRNDEEVRESLLRYREECVNDIVQAKAARDMSIRLFRQRQGGWGDG